MPKGMLKWHFVSTFQSMIKNLRLAFCDRQVLWTLNTVQYSAIRPMLWWNFNTAPLPPLYRQVEHVVQLLPLFPRIIREIITTILWFERILLLQLILEACAIMKYIVLKQLFKQLKKFKRSHPNYRSDCAKLLKLRTAGGPFFFSFFSIFFLKLNHAHQDLPPSKP